MPANDSFHIAVIAGDGIGPEVMAPALEVLRRVEATTPGLQLRYSAAPAGAGHYRDTGQSLPQSTIKLCRDADAILLGACGLPEVRYPDGTEIMPQVELRFVFDLYAGVRPARLIPGVPSPIVGADKHGIDLILIRESTEGLFASIGKGVVSHDEARETLVITRKTSQRLFDFAFRLAERRKARGRPGRLACVDKANAFKAYAFFRQMFDEAAARHPGVTDRAALCRCLRRHAGAPAVGLRRAGDGEHVRRHSLRPHRRACRRHGHGAVGRYRRPPRRVPALPRHRARHHGQGAGQSLGDDSVGRDDARLARRPARSRAAPRRRPGASRRRWIGPLPAASNRPISAAATAPPRSPKPCWRRFETAVNLIAACPLLVGYCPLPCPLV